LLHFLRQYSSLHGGEGAFFYVVFLVLFLCSFLLSGAGVGHYGILTVLAAGLALFAATLWIWSPISTVCAVFVLICCVCGSALYELYRGVAPTAGMLNVNQFACFLTTALPIAVGVCMRECERKKWDGLFLATIALVLLTLLVLSQCRTALAVSILILLGMLSVREIRFFMGSAMVSCVWHMPPRILRKTLGWSLARLATVSILALAGCSLIIIYSITSSSKSLSAVGRVLIWRLAAKSALDNWPCGLGFGNYGRTCSLYQAAQLGQGCEPVPLRMAAGQIGHAFSEPLELCAELGVWGLMVVVALTVVILCQVGTLIWRYLRVKHDQTCTTSCLSYDIDIVAVGMAFAVLTFLHLSLVYFPRKFMPTFALFNVALAWVVRVNGGNMVQRSETERHSGRWKRWSWAVFWAVVCVGACALTPYHVRRYLAARQWSRAIVLAQARDLTGALSVCEHIEARLAWNGKFRVFQGDLLLSSATDTNCPAPTSVKRATELYEHAKYTYPDPYMFENLAVAYLCLADGTNWPVVVQTQYRMETPAQTIARKLREWRCGTNLFFEPPPTRLTQSQCIGRAIDYLTLASNILPWRLTSRWYLAQVYRDVGDVSNAVKYAQLVVSIPMKKDTPQGREFKRKAQKMLNELGVQCDDPGMVVFDIRDRKTWNEGRW